MHFSCSFWLYFDVTMLMSNAHCAINPIFSFIFGGSWLPKSSTYKTHKMFFCTGVDRFGSQIYIIYHDYQCIPARWEGFNECEKWQHRRPIVRVWDKTRPRTVRNVLGVWASIRSCKGIIINWKFRGNVNDKNSKNDNGMKYLLVTLNCLSIVVTSAVQHVLHF